MKLISWNVNGLRACMQKGFAEFFTASDADIFCIQESKLQEGQIDFAPEGYYAYWNYAQKRATPAPPFLPERNLCRCITASAFHSTIPRDV